MDTITKNLTNIIEKSYEITIYTSDDDEIMLYCHTLGVASWGKGYYNLDFKGVARYWKKIGIL